MALALARRYRPKRFTDLLVQDHVAAVLRGAVVRNRVGHGYLLTGPRGVGKTTAARILAMALNCERKETAKPPGEPCGECPNCLRIWNGAANLDVVEIDAASNRGVDDARELRERAMYAASQEGGHKVYIIDEAHMLTREAWNALLKILEEPPPGVVFVFATTEPQKIAQTAAPVMSRLQRFDFRRIGPAVIRRRLREVLDAEGIAAEDDALTLIARHADGGMRDALSVLDQCLSLGDGSVTVARVRDTLGLVTDEWYGEILSLVVERRPARVFTLMDRLMDAGADLAEFVNGTAEVLRALLMLQVGAEPEGLTEGMRHLLQMFQGRLEPGDVLRMLKMISENEAGIRRGGNARLQVETLLLRWTMLDRIIDLQQVLAGAAAPSSMPGRGSGPASRSGATAVPPPRATLPATPLADESSQSPAPEHSAPAPPIGKIPFTLESLRSAWPEVVAAGRERSRVLGEVLAAAHPAEVDPPVLAIRVDQDDPMGAAILGQRDAIESLIGQRVSGPVHLKLVTSSRPGGDPAPRPRRLSDAENRAERLRLVQAKDATLGAAASELDLEIVD